MKAVDRYYRRDAEEVLYQELQHLRSEVREMRYEINRALEHIVGLAVYADKVHPGTAAAYTFTQKLKDL